MSGAMTAEKQHAMTPADALRELREGNDRFVHGDSAGRDLREQARETAGGQAPHAAVLACMDSRGAPEHVFDQGIGDIFGIRVAGNYVDAGILGGLEFAAELVGVRLIVVMGHTGCGAVRGACEGAELGHLTGTLANLRPAVEAARAAGADELIPAVTEANVRMGVERITRESAILRARVDAGTLAVVGAVHDLASGRVTFFED